MPPNSGIRFALFLTANVLILVWLIRTLPLGSTNLFSPSPSKLEQLETSTSSEIQTVTTTETIIQESTVTSIATTTLEATQTVIQTHTVLPLTYSHDQQKPLLKHCDPYNEPGYFNASDHVYWNTTYYSLNPGCQPLYSDIFTKMKKKEEMPELVNKTAIFFGDSVDRRQLVTICGAVKGVVTQTYQEDHNKLWNTTEVKESPNCFPRVCHVPHYNFTMAIYFMYGFDSDGIWMDRKEKFWEPQQWRARLDLFSKTVNTLNRGDPDIAFFNFGLWELARLDRLASWAKMPETMSFNQTQLAGYQENLLEFTTKLKARFPQSQLVYREAHYPLKARYRYTAVDKPRNYRYAAQKVDQLNHVAQSIMKNEGVVYWPIGQLTRGMPKRELYMDDVHPNRRSFLGIWGPGIMEYILRSPRLSEAAEVKGGVKTSKNSEAEQKDKEKKQKSTQEKLADNRPEEKQDIEKNKERGTQKENKAGKQDKKPEQVAANGKNDTQADI